MSEQKRFMRLLRLIFVGGFGLLPMAALPSAMQLTLPVETATSRLNVELCVLAECDMQTSQLQGSVTVGLDLDSVPPQISLRDFNLQASSNYNFHLDYGLLGDIFAQARGLRVYHAAPGPAQPFVVVTNQQFTFVNVPYRLSGTADYNASGVICSLIQGNGQPCTGNLDLATQPAALISELSGMLDTNNNVLRLSVQFTFLSPIDSTNPDLGTIAGSAVVNFSAPFRPGLVHAGSLWKYHDLGVDLGTEWRSATYNDGAWLAGPARLGYGGDGEVTQVSFGPDSLDKHITTYFRHGFVVEDPSLVQELTVQLLRDDGAVVYLNGTEVFRNNMPSGALTFRTLAVTNVGGPDEFSFYSAGVSPSLLVLGTNMLAVEVHQGSTNSSDLGFDLALTAVTVTPTAPALRIAPGDPGYVLSWPSTAVGFHLWATTSLRAPITWTPINEPVRDDGTWRTVRVPDQGEASFFRLAAE